MTRSRKATSLAAIAIVGMSLTAFATQARATDDHLLLCEIVLTPTGGEYIEISNPTGSTVNLDNYYVTDDEDYALLPGQFGAGPAPAIGSSDFIARFPAGSSIGAGDVIVVAFTGADHLVTYGSVADFELIDTDGTANMDEAYTGSIGMSAGLTNSGEMVGLFFWDGATDLVSDVDLMNVGTPSTSNDVGNKTGLMVDGPDGDTVASTYAADAGTIPQQASDPGFGFSTKRVFVEAGQESTGGGNGITGDDETSENIAATWDAAFTPPDPGVCDSGTGEPMGACCDSDGFVCTDDVAESACQGGTETFHAGLACDAIVCAAVGACCVTGQCYDGVTIDTCNASGGSFEGEGTSCSGTSCTPASGVVINEIRIDDNGDPEEEYFELFGAAATSLNDLTYIVLGDDFNQVNGSGVIESVTSLAGQSINGSGYFTVAEDTFTLATPDLVATALGFENSDNVTHLLVSGFSGALDDDLDTDDDGVLDVTPWTGVVDCLSLIETTEGGDLTYCAAASGPDGTFVPSHVLRCGDGGQWQIGDFFVDNDDTPGDLNDQVCGSCCDGANCSDDRTSDDCTNGGGAFQGEGSTCAGVNCDTGACCTAGACSDGLDQVSCENGGGVFQGAATDCLGTSCTADSAVIITEIMYNPNSSEAVPNQVEWVEIYNTGVDPVDISGWSLADEDGMTGAFPGGTEIDGGEAIVIIPDDQTVTEFQDAWGSGYQILAVSGWGVPGMSSLSNSPSDTNEILTLLDAGLVAADVVNFDDEGDWPEDFPDGPSIRVLCTALDPVSNDDGTNWVHTILGVNGGIANVVGGDFGGNDLGSPGMVVCPEEGIGACCQPDETCFETSEKFCDNLGLTFFGEGSTCLETVCPPVGSTGACCTEGDCEDAVSQLVCEENGGTFQGADSTCAGVGSCPAGSPLIISEIVEGTLDNNDGFGPSNQPRFVELTNVGCDPINLAAYSIGNFNNGGLTLGGGSATQLSGTLAAGESHVFCYCAEPPLPDGVIDVYGDVYGAQPDAFAGGGFINGNDNIALYRGLATGGGEDATLVDVYGVIGEAEDAADFSMPWAYGDTVARRNSNILAPSAIFDISEWTIDAQGSLQGIDDAESTTLIQANTNPGSHAHTDTCGGGGDTEPPFADDAFDVDGTVKLCVDDAECKAGETGPDAQTVCRDGACYVARQRYLSIMPNALNAGGDYAYRISLDTGVAGSSVLGFAGAPTATGVTGPGPNTFQLVRIEDTPHYMDWTTLSPAVVSAGDCEISPGNNYIVQTIAMGADTGEESNYSAGLELPTPQHNGDVTGGGNPGDPPNGQVGSLVDVFSIIKGFQNTQNEPKDWLDINPSTGVNPQPNMVVSLADAFDGILAFQNNPYAGPAPLACP